MTTIFFFGSTQFIDASRHRLCQSRDFCSIHWHIPGTPERLRAEPEFRPGTSLFVPHVKGHEPFPLLQE